MTEVLEPIPVAEAVTTHLAEAARLLEQALKAGCRDPQVAYLLGLCYKGLGKPGEAREAFRKIAEPDANVYLQLGLLSFAEKAFAQAEQEFAKSWELDPNSYEAAYDLMLSRLCRGQTAACAGLIPQIAALASPAEQRFLALVEALLGLTPAADGMAEATNGDATREAATREALLAEMSPAEELRLLQTFGGLGQFDVAYPLLRKLAGVRTESPSARAAYLEVALVQAKSLADRADWQPAKDLLAPLGRLAT